MAPKITRHGGPSFEEEPVKITRPSLVPDATDKKGGESKSVGSNSKPSERKPNPSGSSEKRNPQQPAPTTESHSSRTDKATFGVNTTDGPTQETETESVKTSKRTPRVRLVKNDDFD